MKTLAEFWPRTVLVGEGLVWVGARIPDGYGSVSVPGRNQMGAHRWIYEQTVGPIPEGMQLDHLCRNRACVNVNHLEPVTIRTNVLRGVGLSAENARKTHCHRGHPFDEVNTYLRKSGARACRRCSADWMARKRARYGR